MGLHRDTGSTNSDGEDEISQSLITQVYLRKESIAGKLSSTLEKHYICGKHFNYGRENSEIPKIQLLEWE